MSARQHRFAVHTDRDWGAVIRAVVNGEVIEVFRKEPIPPLAYVTAPDLTSALALARQRYGHKVVVSQPGVVQTVTASSSPVARTGGER